MNDFYLFFSGSPSVFGGSHRKYFNWNSDCLLADTAYSMSDLLSHFPQSKLLRQLHPKAASWGCPSSIWFLLKNSFPEALSHILPLSLWPTFRHSGCPWSCLHKRRNKMSLERGLASLPRVRRLSKHFNF